MIKLNEFPNFSGYELIRCNASLSQDVFGSLTFKKEQVIPNRRYMNEGVAKTCNLNRYESMSESKL